jgi:hypothetical protein
VLSERSFSSTTDLHPGDRVVLATPGVPAVQKHVSRMADPLHNESRMDGVMNELIKKLRGIWTVVELKPNGSDHLIRVDNGHEWRDVSVLWVEQDYVVEGE